MKRAIYALAIVLIAVSCLPVNYEEPKNDNAEFYGTEWSTDDGSEGVRFYTGDRILFFSQGKGGTFSDEGKFHYIASSKLMGIEEVIVNFPTYMTEITLAEKIDDTTLKVYWHYMGDSKNYYELMYRRR